MKKSKLFGWAFMALTGLSACADDASDVLTGENEIQLTSEITPSRVTSLDYQSTQIEAGQEVGVTITGGKSTHKNVAWTVGKNGELTNTGNPIFWTSDDVAITAYHPYNSAWTGTSHEFSVRTNQAKEENYLNSDLLWVTTSASKTENAIPLVFDHKLAKVNVTLVPENEEVNLSGASIYVCGTKIKANFNPTTGVLTNTSNVQDIKAGVTVEDAYTASAIVIPQTVSANTQFIKIVLDDKVFSYKTGNEGKELKEGCSHNYTLTIKEADMQLVSTNITNWEPENNLGEVEQEDLSWFDPNQYITYVGNGETIYPNEDDWYEYSSYINCPVTINKIEFKYKMNESPNSIYLCCRNRARDNTSAISMSKNGLFISYDDYDDDDNDCYKDYSYTWDELKCNITDCMTLTISFKDKLFQINDNVIEYKMLDYTHFYSSFLYSYYFSENDEGLYRCRGEGVPEGSKLYYVKIWDENDNLTYLGGASIALNPKTNQEEYCWRSYYNGKHNYEFAYYPETHSNYTPYGGGIDNI